MKNRFRASLTSIVALLLIFGGISNPSFAVAGYPNPGRDSSTNSYVQGAYIIDSGAVSNGATRQTIGQGLKPYGLVYALLKAKVEVDWVINTSKAQIDQTLGNAGIDFTFDCDGSGSRYISKNYRTGAFVIPKEFAAQAKPIVESWLANSANAGLVVDGPCTEAIPNLPVFAAIQSWPRTSLDAQNGKVAIPYYTNAGIPQGSTTDPNNPPAYRYAAPSQLTACDDLYIMPHADPTYATHKELKAFVLNGGSFYASCHAVSEIENMADPNAPGSKFMNFLTSDGLINYDSHSQGTPAYNFYKPSSDTQAFKGSNDGITKTDLESVRPGDPMAQFLGVTTAATQQGSEQIFIPKIGSYWRPTTQIIQYDPSQSNASATNGPATSLAYGPAFGDTTGTNGYVYYQGGHSLNKGTVDDVAAQRAFFNMVLLTAVDRRPAGSVATSRSPKVEVSEPAAGVTIAGGLSIPVTGTATGGSGSYSYSWSAECYDLNGQAVAGGTFADGASPDTTFTAPAVTGKVNCNMTLTVVDTCGRFSFGVRSVVFAPEADLSLTKTVSPASPTVGALLTYTLVVKNNGKIAGTQDSVLNTATDVLLTDPLPAGVTFNSVSSPVFSGTAPTGATCTNTGNLVECDLKDMVDEQTATITITALVNSDQGGQNVANRATVTSSAADTNPANNSQTATSAVQNIGITVVVTTDKPLVDAVNGTSITYTYTVSNIGNAALTQINLKDNLGTTDISDDISPAYESGDAGSDSVLGIGEVWIYKYTRILKGDSSDDDDDSNPLTKRIVASVSALAGSVNVSSQGSASVQAVTPRLVVIKTTETPKVKQGGTGYFTIKVQNDSDGPLTLTNIDVTDTFTTGSALTCKILGTIIPPTNPGVAGTATYRIASLEQNQEWSARCELTDIQINGTNSITASAPNPLAAGSVTPNIPSSVGIEIAEPDLTISKTSSQSTARVGDSYYYNLTASNNSSTTTQTNVQITDLIPTELQVTGVTRNYLTASASAGSRVSGVIAWDKNLSGNTSGGAGWKSGSNWVTSGVTSSSSGYFKFSFAGSSSTKSMTRTVSLDKTRYSSLSLNLECTSDTTVSPALSLTASTLVIPGSASGSCSAASIKSSQISTSSLKKQITYTFDASLLPSTATDFALEISAAGTSGKSMLVSDIYLTSGQIAFDSVTSSSDGVGWSNSWGITAINSSYFKISSGEIYVSTNKNAKTTTYSGTAKRTVLIPQGSTLTDSGKLSFACYHDSFSDASDSLVITANGNVIFRNDTTQNVQSTSCTSSSSSRTQVSVPLPAGEVEIVITASSKYKKIKISDFLVSALSSGTVTSSTSGLTRDALTSGYSLAPGQKIEFLVYVTVIGEPTDSPEIINTAFATSDQQEVPSVSSAAVTILSAGFAVTKTVSSPLVAAGTSVTYTYTVTNTGNTDIQDLNLKDQFDANNFITIVSSTPLVSGDPSTLSLGSGVTQTSGSIASNLLSPGQAWVFTVSSGVLNSTKTGTATLTGFDRVEVDGGVDSNGDPIVTYEPTELDPSLSAKTVTVVSPGLTVDTSASGATVANPLASKIYSGRTVTYTYRVTNTGSGGSAVQSPVVIAENCTNIVYVSGDSNSDKKLQSGETWIFTCTTTAITVDQSSKAITAQGVDDILNQPVISPVQNASVTVFAQGSITLDRSVANATDSSSASWTSGTLQKSVGLVNSVSFTYVVTNLGTPLTAAAYADVVKDDQCPNVTYVSGDVGDDKIMAASEAWTFSCSMPANLPTRIISTATATMVDGIGGLAKSPARRIDLSVLAPSLILMIEPANEYVRYGQSMLFNYSIENNGGVAIPTFTASDDSCTPLVRSSVTASAGYTPNNDSILDVGEIWNYTCTRANYTADNMSSFSVTGITDALSYSGYQPAPANAKVFVVDPSLAVTQKATVYDPASFVSPADPGAILDGPALEVDAKLDDVVVYTYEITSGVSTNSSSIAGLNSMLLNLIMDAQCSPIVAVDRDSNDLNDGDSNGNGQVDPGETWIFECANQEMTATAAVIDAQATVYASSVSSDFTVQPAATRVTIAGAMIYTPPAQGNITITLPSPTPVDPGTPVDSNGGNKYPKLSAWVYFAGDSAVLSTATKKKLRDLALKAKKIAAKPYITVIGRVRETPDKSYDARLSLQRARNVRNYLKTLGVKGTYKVVSAGISPENRPMSRRAEVTIRWK